MMFLVRPEGYPLSIEGEHETLEAALEQAERSAGENWHNYIVIFPDGTKRRVHRPERRPSTC